MDLNSRDLPEVLDVVNIQRFLGIGRTQAYELVNSGQFHIVRINRRIKIPRDGFITWLKGGNIDTGNI